MVTNRALFLLIVIGLTTGCAARMSALSDAQPSPISSPMPSPVPPQTRGPDVEPATETSEMVTDRATPFAFPPIDRRPPPAKVDDLPLTPVEMARIDLAHRLHTDTFLVDVVEVVVREPDVEVMPCLGDILSEELWRDLSEVEWISLAVKGNVHHYVALGELVLYCDE